MASPTQRTLKLLRAEGFSVAVVEKWIAQLKIRKDCFGADVLAVNAESKKILLVQCTTLGNLSSRVRKVQKIADVGIWLLAGGAFECWGWSKREGKWTVRRVAITPDTMQAVELTPREPRRRKAKAEKTLFDEF